MPRPRHPMPDDVKKRLAVAGVAGDYAARPAYQRNDYIGWITMAKGAATREKRIGVMIRELREGGVYMNAPHRPSAKVR